MGIDAAICVKISVIQVWLGVHLLTLSESQPVE